MSGTPTPPPITTTVPASGTATTSNRSLLGTIVDDFSEWFREGETFVETEAKALWGVFKGILHNILPEQWAILFDLVKRAQGDLAANKPLDETVADVLTLAAQEELRWIGELGSDFITAAVVFVKGPAATPAAGA